MSKVPFYLGNLAACFVPGTENRRHVRAAVNLFLYRPKINKFIRRTFGERVKTVKFIRQITLNRVVCLVNDKYYVKIFRDVSNKTLKDFEFISNYIRPFVSVTCPEVIVAPHAQMYVCEKVQGRHISTFPADEILKNKDKIEQQVMDIIAELQAIDVKSIPGWRRFMYSMQLRTKEKPGPKKMVLAHFDLNETNLFFDNDLNICAVIDWDTLSIAQNPETDRNIFMKYWVPFINSLK